MLINLKLGIKFRLLSVMFTLFILYLLCMRIKFFLFIVLSIILAKGLSAKSDKFRCMWRQDPATSMTIGWDQVSGTSPVVYFDTKDHGNDVAKYRYKKMPDTTRVFHEMRNTFVRFNNLVPNTVYYLIVKDSEGQSRRLSFRTAPNDADTRLSIIAGGDSRNQREACCKANLLVSKLHPHFVLFGGDMTDNDNAAQWKTWLEDWQLTITEDGRMTPIVVSRGNHEYSNKTLIELFDLPFTNLYYKLAFGGNLLSVYTLNSLISAAGDQKDWLQEQLAADQDFIWRMTQYHFPIRPHVKIKTNKNDQAIHWSNLFKSYDVGVAIESDAHLAKITYPIKPYSGPGSDEGFIRDDQGGTVYLGEGGWGAPLRKNDSNKSWTMESGSFNHFNWLWVDRNDIQIRTVKTLNADQVVPLNINNVFAIPEGIDLWSMAGNVVYTIDKKSRPSAETLLAGRGDDASQTTLLKASADGKVRFGYTLDAQANLEFSLYNNNHVEVLKTALPTQAPGKYERNFELKSLPPGKYLLIIRANKKLIQKYKILKT